MSYDGSAARRSTVDVRNNPLAGASASTDQSKIRNSQSEIAVAGWPKGADGSPDFDSMNSAQRHAYHRARLNRVFR